MPAPWDLLIFDCDGVLVDSETLAFQAFADVLNDAGVPVTVDTIGRLFGMKQADVLNTVSELTGRAIPPEVAERLWPVTRARLESSLKAMPGVAAYLEATPTLRRCVASSSQPERIRLSLEVSGLARFFGTAVFSSHQVANGKPAPDLFLFAARQMGTEPARCLVIEDSIYGVQGAIAAGMTAIGFVGGSHIPAGHDERLRAAGAVAVARDWSEIARQVAGHAPRV